VVADVVVRSDDVLLLGDEELLDRKRERLFESIGVSLLGYVFTLLGGGEDFMVALDDGELDVAPGAVESACDGTGFLHVMKAGVVKFGLEVATEAGALERLGDEELLQVRVLEVLGEVGEALLAVFQHAGEVLEDTDYFVIIDRFRHGVIPSNQNFDGAGCGAGSAGCGPFSVTGDKRRKWRKPVPLRDA
jgi:hypothetical protein